MALLAALPVVAVAFRAPLAERAHAREDALQATSSLVRSAAREQADVVDSARQQLETLALVPAIQSADEQACRESLHQVLRERRRFTGIAVLTADGRPHCLAVRDAANPRAIVNQGLARWAVEAGVTAIAPVSVDDPRQILIAHPIRDELGAVTRTLIAAIRLSGLQSVRLQLPPGATLTVFDGNRRILFRDPDSARWHGKQVTPDEQHDMAEGVAVDGVARIHVVAPIDAGVPLDLFVGIGVPRAVLFAESEAALRSSLWFLVVVSLSGFLIVVVGGEAFLIAPITHLSKVVQRLAKGERGVRADIAASAPGLSELRDALNEMATALETREEARELAERQLRASEELYRVPFESAPHASWLFDMDTLRFVEVNRAACEQYGFTQAEFLGMTILDIRPPEEIQKTLDVAEQLKRSSTARPASRWTHRKKDGTLIAVEVSSMLVTIGGRRLGLVLAHDISEREQLEQQLHQSQKMEAIGRLAGGVAHDFNNLLTAILGCSGMVLQDLDPGSPFRADLEEIQKAGNSAASLTRQLLAFSRRQVLQPQILSLNDVVNEVKSLLQRVIGEDVKLVQRLQVDLGLVSADRGQLEQVLMNLAVNARDAMPDGGQVTIETREIEFTDVDVTARFGTSRGPHVMLLVTDTGTGMSEAVRLRIFEPFFTTKEEGKGTGLGLATVYGIVRQSGGSISVESTLGKGTTFKVYLPVVTKSHQAIPVASFALDTTREEATILLVEDQAPVRGIVRRALAAAGYTVLEAGDGQEALRVVNRHAGPIDLVLTDVVMPTMNGPDLVQHVRALYTDVRVLYMSGYTDDAVIRSGAMNSDDPFLQKPFTPQVVMEKVRETLAGSRSQEHALPASHVG